MRALDAGTDFSHRPDTPYTKPALASRRTRELGSSDWSVSVVCHVLNGPAAISLAPRGLSYEERGGEGLPFSGVYLLNKKENQSIILGSGEEGLTYSGLSVPICEMRNLG